MILDMQQMKLRVLAEFDDKNSEDVFGTLGAILPNPQGEISELALYCSALLSFVSEGVIVFGFGKHGQSLDEILDAERSAEFVAELPAWFKFDASQRYWTLTKGQFGKTMIPVIVLTELGEAKALDVRIKHGFRWWDNR